MRASGALHAGSATIASCRRTNLHVTAVASAHAMTNAAADGTCIAITAQTARHVTAYPSNAPETHAAGCPPKSARPSGQPGTVARTNSGIYASAHGPAMITATIPVQMATLETGTSTR